jgi:hypothetical protein
VGLKASREITVRSADGSVTVLSETDKLEQSNTFVVACDGPKCASRRNVDAPVEVRWVDTDIKDGTDMPEGFFSLIKITVNPVDPKEYSFCGPNCARDYLQYTYRPSQSPKALLRAEEEEKKKQAEELKTLNPHLVSGSREKLASAEVAPGKARIQKIERMPEDPETNARRDTISKALVQNCTAPIPGARPVDYKEILQDLFDEAGWVETRADDIIKSVATPTVEVPAVGSVCQADGYAE